MANVTAQLKRAFVSWLEYRLTSGDLKESASDNPLREAILAFTFSSVHGVKTGQVIASTSGNGYSGSFQSVNPSLLAGFSPPEIAALAQELLEIHDIARRDVVNCLQYGLSIDTINVEGWPSTLPAEVMTNAEAEDAATDAQVCAQMRYLLPTVTEVRNDYTYLRGGAA